MTDGSTDPRPARSRARLLDAATALLRSGGPSAVTIDAVTRSANVARATLYRHFPSANDLLGRGVHEPAAARSDAAGRRRSAGSTDRGGRRLVRVDRRGARHAHRLDVAGLRARRRSLFRCAPNGFGCRWHPCGRGSSSSTPRRSTPSSTARRPRPKSMSPTVLQAIALLIGPLILGRLSTLADFDYHTCTEAAVDGFLATHARKKPISAASTESAGA